MTKNLWLSLFALIISILVHYAIGSFWGKVLADCLVAGVAAGIVWIWSPAASRALRRGALAGEDKIILMIWSAWAMYLVQRVYALTSAAIGDPLWLTQGFVPQVIATVIFLAGMYGLTAPASPVGERHPPSVISGWFVSGLVAGGTIVYAILTSGFSA